MTAPLTGHDLYRVFCRHLPQWMEVTLTCRGSESLAVADPGINPFYPTQHPSFRIDGNGATVTDPDLRIDLFVHRADRELGGLLTREIGRRIALLEQEPAPEPEDGGWYRAPDWRERRAEQRRRDLDDAGRLRAYLELLDLQRRVLPAWILRAGG